MDANDSARAIGAAQAFGLISTEAWPMVAAYLVAEGFEGADTVAMAALPLRSSAWDVEPLIDGILGDIDASAAANDDAAWIVARLLASNSGVCTWFNSPTRHPRLERCLR